MLTKVKTARREGQAWQLRYSQCIFLQSLHQPTHALNKIHSWAIIKNPTSFGTEVPSSGGHSIWRNVDPTHQSSYYVAFTEVIRILSIKILKYVKLMTINLQCCNINIVPGILPSTLHGNRTLDFGARIVPPSLLSPISLLPRVFLSCARGVFRHSDPGLTGGNI